MELPGAVYLYTLATLAMTFAGFCAIVIGLRQTTGKRISGFHIVLTRLYLESGLFAAAFCMLPPLLGVCGQSAPIVWRASSAIIAILKPELSSPSNADAGMRHLSNVRLTVFEPRIPILSSALPMMSPGVPP